MPNYKSPPNKFVTDENRDAYRSWQNMKRRCRDTKRDKAHCYVGRGIKVCDRWRSFSNFFADMGRRPVGYSLDRIDTNGNYSPENCRWATQSQQCRNRTNNRLLEFQGRKVTLTELAQIAGLKIPTLHFRLKHGWAVEEAVTTPLLQ